MKDWRFERTKGLPKMLSGMSNANRRERRASLTGENISPEVKESAFQALLEPYARDTEMGSVYLSAKILPWPVDTRVSTTEDFREYRIC